MYNGSYIFPPKPTRKYLSIRAHIHMTIQQALEPPTSRSLHRQNCKEPYRVPLAFAPINVYQNNILANYYGNKTKFKFRKWNYEFTG